jgi:hypothetical protein
MRGKQKLVVAAALVAGVLIGRGFLRPDVKTERVPWAGPTVLQKVQALGDLRTVRYTYQNVFEVETTREPEGMLASLPGVTNVVHATTRNKALVSASGSVEAGVDLTKARYETKPEGTVLVLPKPRLFPPDVRLHVHRAKPGVFWRDDNLTVKATDVAREKFTTAGLQQGILPAAQKSARERVEALVQGSGANVQVRFDP